jgi:hypothetical protein
MCSVIAIIKLTDYFGLISIILLSIYGFTALCWTLAAFSVCWTSSTVGRTPWAANQLVARPLPAYRAAQTQNRRKQTSMPQVEFKSTVPMFESAKTVHSLDRMATVIGMILLRSSQKATFVM